MTGGFQTGGGKKCLLSPNSGCPYRLSTFRLLPTRTLQKICQYNKPWQQHNKPWQQPSKTGLLPNRGLTSIQPCRRCDSKPTCEHSNKKHATEMDAEMAFLRHPFSHRWLVFLTRCNHALLDARLRSDPFEDPAHPANLNFKGMQNIVAACKATGVKKVVRLTGLSVGLSPWNPISILFSIVLSFSNMWNRRGEQVLRESGLDYSIVRPGGLKDVAPGMYTRVTSCIVAGCVAGCCTVGGSTG